MRERIQELLQVSRQVFQDCTLPNGAVVAAPSHKPYYPKEAKNYYFVWPRDALYACLAAKVLGMKIQEPFFAWCTNAESWKETGLFYEKYFVDGRKAREHFQPDQTGSVLIALYEHCRGDAREANHFAALIEKSANGLCNVWNGTHFTIVTQDLWEERLCFPDVQENFTYSLAICSRGLWCASQLMPNPRWLQAAQEMQQVLERSNTGYFYRSHGKLKDQRIDASSLGLVWPACIIKAADARMVKTVQRMEQYLVQENGLHRYEHDRYDGWMHGEIPRNKGAGYWPLLNFWMAMYYAEKGDKDKALLYYRKVLSDIDDLKTNYIPEQIFQSKIQVSASPLLWSHAMFVLASKKLGFL